MSATVIDPFAPDAFERVRADLSSS